MTGTSAVSRSTLGRLFEGPWRDDTPVFACCRRSVTIALDRADLSEVALLQPAARVQALREAVETELPGHLATHRCCVGHLADLAFDLPDLLAAASE